VEAVLAVLNAVLKNTQNERLLRATNQYQLALDSWKLGAESMVSDESFLRGGEHEYRIFFDGPIGLLYYAGSAWTFLAGVVFMGLLFIALSRKNRS
jgi:hypothetical protein